MGMIPHPTDPISHDTPCGYHFLFWGRAGEGDEGLGRVGAGMGGDIRTGANQGEDTWPGPGWLTAACMAAFCSGVMGGDGSSLSRTPGLEIEEDVDGVKGGSCGSWGSLIHGIAGNETVITV